MRNLIAAAYAECLNVSRVRAEDDFFLLGGDSLKAMRVVSRLRHSLRGAVSVRDLFEHPRVDRLAHVLHARIPSSGAEAAAESESAAPVLSFSQERMWMAEQLAPSAAPYNLAAAIVMKGPLNAGAFEQSVGEVRRRHSVLRTRVVMRDGVLIPQLSDTPDDDHPSRSEGDRSRRQPSRADRAGVGVRPRPLRPRTRCAAAHGAVRAGR